MLWRDGVEASRSLLQDSCGLFVQGEGQESGRALALSERAARGPW